jgi:hypothetical protein
MVDDSQYEGTSKPTPPQAATDRSDPISGDLLQTQPNYQAFAGAPIASARIIIGEDNLHSPYASCGVTPLRSVEPCDRTCFSTKPALARPWNLAYPRQDQGVQ